MPWFVNDALKACYWVSEPFWVVEVHRPRKPAVPAGFTEVAMEAELALEPGVPAELQTIRQPGVKGVWKLNRKGNRAFWQDNNQTTSHLPDAGRQATDLSAVGLPAGRSRLGRGTEKRPMDGTR